MRSLLKHAAGRAGAMTALVVATISIVGCGPVAVEVGSPPETRAEDIVEVLHGVDVADPYRWLEDQDAAETRAWIDAQNSYTDSVIEQLPGQDELRELITRTVKIDDISVPYEYGGRYFFTKRGAADAQASIWMRQGIDGEDRLLVDVGGLSDDDTKSVDIEDASADGTLLAYSVRVGGVDEIEVRFLDVDTGEELPDRLATARIWAVDITPDRAGAYYSWHGAEGPRIFYHQFGSDSEDSLVFGEGYGPEMLAFGALSEDGEWLLVHVFHGSSGPSEIHLKDVAHDGPWKTVINDGVTRSTAGFAGEQLMIMTDLDAPRRRLMIADPQQPAVASWRELVPENQDAVLENAVATGGKVLVQFLENVQTVASVFDLDGTKVRDIAFEVIGAMDDLRGRWGSPEVRFSFSSFHIPDTIYSYDVATGVQEVWAEIEVPIDSDAITVVQEWCPSADGTEVPVFIVHRNDVKLDGKNPTLIYGYGGFNVSITPYFNGTRAAWVQQGGVYVATNLRGGGEFGEEWHRAGMLESKQNTFDDLYAVCDHLIERGYTSSEHLAVYGGSNGGLLVGAAMTQRPELVKAVVCTYPLLDMIRYHKFLVAGFWVPEYGSSDDAEQFQWIYDYSPYHHVKDGVAYPATLFITGDGDTRVAPLHARKMAAMVQARTGGPAPILLRYHTKHGHSGGMPVEQKITDGVEMLSFLRWQLGG